MSSVLVLVGVLVLLGLVVGFVVVMSRRARASDLTPPAPTTADASTDSIPAPRTSPENEPDVAPAPIPVGLKPEPVVPDDAAPSQPAPADSVAASPVAAEPTIAEPIGAEPTLPEPTAEPIAEPAAEPIAEPAAAEPIAEPAAEPIAEPAAAAPVETEPATSVEPTDDFRKIEGIGPKMATALHSAGIRTYRQLADTDEASLRSAVKAAGMRATASLPMWPERARALAGDE